MRRLILVRHAKSSWKNPGLSDRERPLNKRGYKDVPIMAARVADLVTAINNGECSVFSSPAVRAKAIAEGICVALGEGAEDEVHPHFREALYTFSGRQLHDAITTLPDDKPCCIVVGHNPALTDCANALIANTKGRQGYIENIPTSGVVVLECEVGSWRDLTSGCCKLTDFDFPKRERWDD